MKDTITVEGIPYLVEPAIRQEILRLRIQENRFKKFEAWADEWSLSVRDALISSSDLFKKCVEEFNDIFNDSKPCPKL